MTSKTVSYFVIYRGISEDPDRFLAHYRDVHVPILKRWPGMQRIQLHVGADWTDPEPVKRAGAALIVEMTFDSEEALQTALASDERSLARADFGRFPRFSGEVVHQATISECVYG